MEICNERWCAGEVVRSDVVWAGRRCRLCVFLKSDVDGVLPFIELLLADSMTAGASSGSIIAGAFVGEGAMLTRQRRAPVCSRSPWSIFCPWLLCTSSLFLSMYAVQSASQSLPRLSRLLVKPGMMCTVRACCVGSPRIARSAEAEEALSSPVAVWIFVMGALLFICTSGADAMK